MQKLTYKFMCGVLVIFLSVLMIPLASHAATFQTEYLTFTENTDGTLTVIAYDRSKHESPYHLNIASQYVFNDKYYDVTSIADGIFKGYTFYSIQVGSGISIGNHTFENITVNNYKSTYNIEESVNFGGSPIGTNVTIGDYAFANAQFNSYVTFGHYDSFGDYAFYNTNFGSVDISIFESVSTIGNYCFTHSNLSSTNIYFSQLSSLGDYAFYDTYVKNFDIYDTLKYIGQHAFTEEYPMIFTTHSYVTDISHLYIERIVLDNATFYIHENESLAQYLQDNYISFTVIETGEFYSRKARINETFTYTDMYYFYEFTVISDFTTALTKFTIAPPATGVAPQKEYPCFSYSYTLTTIASNAFVSQPQLQILNLSNTAITHIEPKAIVDCNNLTTVMLPSTLQYIGKDAFPNSENLLIIIPAEITNIQNFDIGNLNNVTFEIDINSPLDKILDALNLNYQYNQNGNIIYPRPAKNTIFAANNLQYKVTGNSTVTLMNPTTKSITKLTIGDSVTYKGYSYKINKINKKAFYKCKKLKKVVIGDNVTTIGDSAFANCTKLTSITFGKKVKKLGKKTLYNNKKLKTIKFEGTKLQSIGKQTFYKVPKKVNIIVPKRKVAKYKNIINKAK